MLDASPALANAKNPSRGGSGDAGVSCTRMPFRDIVGHRPLLALMSRAIAHDTLPPSLLLAGPAGVGKRRAAGAAAEAINCLQPTSSGDLERDGCGACASCRRIQRGVYPDVITLAPGDSGSIKIEQVRDVIDRTAYRPFEGRRRVVIIDEADALVIPAQNALLKTLEEPPSSSILLLVSSMPDALLATVRSRCPRLRFGTLTEAEVAAALMRDHGFTTGEAHAAASDADGSIGRALAAASVNLVDARESATRLLRQAARSADPVSRLDLAKDLAGNRSTPQGEREQLSACLRAAASLIRDLGILASRIDTGALANADLQPELERLSDAYDGKRSVHVYTALDRAIGALERNVSPKVVADWIALQI